MAKHVGLLRAKELFLTNKMLSAEEAKQWGFVTEVIAHDNLTTKARELARQFANGPTKAYGGVKRMLLSSFSAPIESQLDNETRHIVGTMDTHDGPHGLNALFIAGLMVTGGIYLVTRAETKLPGQPTSNP